jgi:hypothetical protein
MIIGDVLLKQRENILILLQVHLLLLETNTPNVSQRLSSFSSFFMTLLTFGSGTWLM